MLTSAYRAQCEAAEARHTPECGTRNNRPALLALALGTFAIGTGEFGSNGIIQLFAADMGISIPQATYAVTAYAVGVMVGSPRLLLFALTVPRLAPPGRVQTAAAA